MTKPHPRMIKSEFREGILYELWNEPVEVRNGYGALIMLWNKQNWYTKNKDEQIKELLDFIENLPRQKNDEKEKILEKYGRL